MAEQPSIVCPMCGRRSYHPKDIENRFCAVCGFHDNMYRRMTDEELAVAAQAALERSRKAPKCISGTEAAPYCSGDAWARESRIWCGLMEEIERRKRAAVYDAILRKASESAR